MPAKKRRSRIILRNDSGQRIDPKSKQLLFFECDVETVKRVPLKSYDEFTQEGAKQVFDKYQNKRQSKSTLYCLTDRIRFEKRRTIGPNPFRKHLTYREIRHFFVFPENPRIFMLCVTDEFGNKAYELYRCQPEDVNTICDLTYGASTDPQNIIRDTDSINQLSASSKDFGTSPSIMADQSPNGVYDNGRTEENYREVKSVRSANVIQTNSLSYNDSIRSIDIFSNHVDNATTLERTWRSKPQNGTSTILNGKPKQVGVTGVYSFYESEVPEQVEVPVKQKQFYQAPMQYQQQNQIKMIKPSTSEIYLSRAKQSPSPIVNIRPIYTKSSTNVSNCAPREIPVGRNSPGRITIVRDYPKRTRSLSKLFHSRLDLRSGDEITFIGRNLNEGTYVTDDGPVYMYITRYESQQDMRTFNPSRPLHRLPRLTPFDENGESDVMV